MQDARLSACAVFQITAHTPFRLIHLPPFVESTFITVITSRYLKKHYN